jgi:hypothetical protein
MERSTLLWVARGVALDWSAEDLEIPFVSALEWNFEMSLLKPLLLVRAPVAQASGSRDGD